MGLAQIKMPQLGESVTEGTVEKWLKSEGDFVKRDEPIVEVVTDKVNAEIPSPFEGKLVKIAVTEGETVRVGAVIAQIETAGGATASSRQRVRSGARQPKEESVRRTRRYLAAPGRDRRPRLPPSPPPCRRRAGPGRQATAGGNGNNDRARLSPAVRKLAAEHGIDAAALRGSGMGGRVTRDDVLAALESEAAPPSAKPAAPAPSAPRPPASTARAKRW